jgi:hypothetical protein
MDAANRRFVKQRAQGRCEYCRLPQAAQPFITFHVEHITAKQHSGSDDPKNLCVACERCNSFKGPNLTGIDPDTGNIERLFNPRVEEWHEHFSLQGPLIVGLTAVGRTTVGVLAMNEERRGELRGILIAQGEF